MTRTRSLIITGLLVSGAALPAAILPGQAALADSPTASAADPGGDTALGAEFFHIQWSADTRRGRPRAHHGIRLQRPRRAC